ncbi:MAG: hypothetical protein VZR27_07610 [Acutalibacteraceae bacterium]|nr:hypothetical protein [Clostridia bacterium]MEE3450549.1 hypothetical protein [Acutalibacteraceae bacterium]
MSNSSMKTVADLVKIKITGGISSLLTFMRGHEKKKSGFSLGTAFIVAIIIIAFLFMMAFSFGLAAALGFQMSMKNCLWLYFPLGIISAAVFSLVGTVFAAQSYLFESTDNELLLSMPIRPSDVLLSRMLALYVLNLVYSTIILLPVGLAYGIFFGYSIITFICYIITLMIVPSLSTGLCCIFGFVVGKITQIIPNKNIMTVIFGFATIAVVAALGLNLGPIVVALMNYIEIIAYNVRELIVPLYWYGLASNEGMFWGILPIILVCIGLPSLVFWFLSIKFLKLVTKKTAMKKKKYVEKPMKKTGLQYALIKKELGYFLSIPAYVMNSGLSTIMSIFLGIGIIMRGDVITEWMPILFPDASSSLMGLAIGSSLALCCTINDVTAPSISLEGKTIWLLKSTPIDPMKVFWGKALLSPIVSLPGVIFTSLASALTLELSSFDVAFIIIIPMISCLFSGFLGICINLKIPRFDWSTEITVIKQSLSVIVTLFVAMFFTSIPFVFAIIPAAYLPDFSAVMSYGLCIAYFLILVVLEIFYLSTDGKKIWDKLG